MSVARLRHGVCGRLRCSHGCSGRRAAHGREPYPRRPGRRLPHCVIAELSVAPAAHSRLLGPPHFAAARPTQAAANTRVASARPVSTRVRVPAANFLQPLFCASTCTCGLAAWRGRRGGGVWGATCCAPRVGECAAGATLKLPAYTMGPAAPGHSRARRASASRAQPERPTRPRRGDHVKRRTSLALRSKKKAGGAIPHRP
jgi:hypothetical protein